MIEAHRHPPGVALRQRLDELRRLERGCPDDHPLHPVVEQRGGVACPPHAPARLHEHVDGSGDLQHDVAVHRFPGPRRVEVYDMDPTGTALDVGAGQRHRIAVAAHAPEITLHEPYRTPVVEIDGREELHGAAHARCGPSPHTATKLARMARPTEPDFSGWNCAPHTGPRSAAATTAPP